MALAHCLAACTIFNATQGNKTLVGDNEDDAYTIHRIWIIPPTSGKNGRVYFTTDLPTASNYIVGGMNQHGLFFDATLYSDRGITLDSNKQTPDWGIVQQLITERCATVSEAIAMYGVYNERSFQNAQFMWVDSTGASAVVGWDYKTNKVAVTRKSGSSQVIANFNIACDQPDPVNDWRYFTAKRILDRGQDISVKLFSQILDSVKTQTLYSIVSNLKTKDVYFSNTWKSGGFSTSCIKFNLPDQFSRGEKIYDCDTLGYYMPAVFFPPSLVSYSPAKGAAAVNPASNLAMAFDKRVFFGSGSMYIVNLRALTLFETIAVPSPSVGGSGTATISIDPQGSLEPGTPYAILFDEACFADTLGNKCEGISSPAQWNFTTAGIARATGKNGPNPERGSFDIAATPAGNELRLSVSAGRTGAYYLTLYDLRGRILLRRFMRIQTGYACDLRRIDPATNPLPATAVTAVLENEFHAAVFTKKILLRATSK
jgi:hypothetical protein